MVKLQLSIISGERIEEFDNVELPLELGRQRPDENRWLALSETPDGNRISMAPLENNFISRTLVRIQHDEHRDVILHHVGRSSLKVVTPGGRRRLQTGERLKIDSWIQLQCRDASVRVTLQNSETPTGRSDRSGDVEAAHVRRSIGTPGQTRTDEADHRDPAISDRNSRPQRERSDGLNATVMRITLTNFDAAVSAFGVEAANRQWDATMSAIRRLVIADNGHPESCVGAAWAFFSNATDEATEGHAFAALNVISKLLRRQRSIVEPSAVSIGVVVHTGTAWRMESSGKAEAYLASGIVPRGGLIDQTDAIERWRRWWGVDVVASRATRDAVYSSTAETVVEGLQWRHLGDLADRPRHPDDDTMVAAQTREIYQLKSRETVADGDPINESGDGLSSAIRLWENGQQSDAMRILESWTDANPFDVAASRWLNYLRQFPGVSE